MKIGLALGSGASRGWSHVGVVKALVREGIEPDVICGTSVGAMVGGAYVAGTLDELERWVLASTRIDVLRFFDIKFSQAGIVNLERWRRFLREHVADESVLVENLPKQYVAVATDLDTGKEVWLQKGALADAVQASMAMPGLYPSVHDGQRWLVDGGLTNPVPVSACRALGADIVIGVNLNTDIVGKRGHRASKSEPPGVIGSISSAIAIFQDRLTRSRLAGDPADVIIAPRLGNMGILEFARAGEAIQEGEECVQKAMPDIRHYVSRYAEQVKQ
jgi:NTE family protein